MNLNSLFWRSRLAWLSLAVLFLSGCASFPPAPTSAAPAREALDAFSLEGRFSLRHENKNYSGKMSWRHQGADNTLLLSSPFGQGMAEITTRENGAQLTTSDGKLYTAADAETLTRQVLGYPLPLAQLTDWVRGRDDAPGLAERDAFGRPLRLRDQGWRIEYGYEGDNPAAAPSRIFAEGVGGLELRLKIDEWTSLAP
jgi:outer membrane lipoprotein LolB